MSDLLPKSFDFWSLLATVATVLVAFVTYRTLKISARRKTTFEALSSQNWDADFITARNIFTDVLVPEIQILNADGIRKLLDANEPTNKLKVPENKTSKGSVYTTKDEVLKMIINHNELLAIGIRLKTLDEQMLYLNSRASFIDDWNALSEFIKYVRRARNNDFVGIEFETVAKKWKRRPPKAMGVIQKIIYRWPQPSN